MKDGSEEKLMPLFWFHWLHADCDVYMIIRNHTGFVLRINYGVTLQ